MTNFTIQKEFTRYGEVFQDEAGISVGYTRRTVEVEGDVGEELMIGRFIGLDSHSADTGVILKTIEDIKSAKVLGIYAGQDAYRQMHTDNPSYNHNVSVFHADSLKQKVTVVHRGRISVARGGVEGTSRYMSGLKYPAGTTPADRKLVEAKLEEQGIHILRQVFVN